MSTLLSKMGRRYVTSAPVEIHKATSPVRVQLWVTSKLHSDQQFRDAAQVVISSSLEACQLELGIPMPFDVPIEVDLDAGDSIWAASFNEAFVGFSVLERK